MRTDEKAKEIYGKVKNTMQITHINVHAQAEKEGETGNLEVVMRCAAPEKGFVCAQLLSEEGQEEDRIFPVPTGEEIDFCMQVPAVRLWDMERAYLYDLLLELRDEQMRLLGCTVKKIVFRSAEKEQGQLWLNGQRISLCPWVCTEEEVRAVLEAPSGCPGTASSRQLGAESAGCPAAENCDCTERKLRCWLAAIKRGRYNALLLKPGQPAWRREMLAELCPQYGLYYTEEAETETAGTRTGGQDAGFELNVTQEGVLLENRCVFTNAAEYELRYGLFHEGKAICQGSLCADVPPGSGRYIELPFAVLHEAGEYVYRASLHLKKDMPWADRGYMIAVGESLISNLFSG